MNLIISKAIPRARSNLQIEEVKLLKALGPINANEFVYGILPRSSGKRLDFGPCSGCMY